LKELITQYKGRSNMRHEIRISFLSKKSPRAKPSISAVKARQLLTALNKRTGVVEAQACTAANCGGVVKGVKAVAAEFGVTLTCRYTCKWFYSEGGGWRKECYFKCKDGNLTVEGTGH
jgi:hypothetical protein